MRKKFDPVITPQMAEKYKSGMAIAEVGMLFGKSVATTHRWLKFFGVDIRKPGEWHKGRKWTDARRAHHPEKPKRPPGAPTGYDIMAERTNGNRYISSHGYVVIKIGRKKRQYEHVLVAEKALGRKLDKGMVVHHINCNKLDNRPTNLLICSTGYHLALHARMRRHEYWKQF